MNMLKRLAKVLSNFPMKSIFIMMIIVVLLAVGVKDVFMATGNDTLVEPSSDVYQDNLMLEEEFGGESIIVLYESENLLTPDHLKHMKGIEDVLQNNDSIYSILSPVTLVEEIANNQSDTFQDGISETIDGLNEMGSQLTDISDELKGNAESDQEMALLELEEPKLPEIEEPSLPEVGETESQLPEVGEIRLPDIEGQIAELNEGFSNMIGAQGNLEEGTTNLVDGYAEFGRQTNELGKNLSELAERMEDTPQKEQIQEASQGLIQLSQQMTQISEDSAQLPGIPEQTIEGLNNIQQKLDEQLIQQNGQLEQIQEQVEKQKEMQAQRQEGQQEKQEQMKQEMKEQQETQQEEMQAKMDEQRAEKEKEMQGLKEEIEGKQKEQAEMLSQLADGLAEMGENLQTISENMKTIYDYSDIMTPGLPENQDTLDNMIYDDDDELRPMFEEVIIDDQSMTMMIKLNGDTEDAEKTEVIDTINNYLDKEEIESAETMVSGKPVLDHATRSSMQESIQTMMGLALIIMVIVLSIVFKVRWRLLPLVTVLIAVIGTVGLMGWLQIPITMVSMAVFPILIGLGIDYAIQFQNRYAEEIAKEDSNE
ncbi:MMPL family transporter [Virgibacillus dokdonensis]|uniref:MMPL family transporter n=1 Tax=Virgibacillus dokdonensis TaxID=302167 RepID=UPI00098AE6CB|nr:MMPL family transporter [Virgibacillus dokdonensis]